MPAKKLKLPRGRTMYARFTKNCTMFSQANLGHAEDWLPVAVIPCATVKQARALTKVMSMPRGDLAILIAAQIFHPLLDNRARDKSSVTTELAYVIIKALNLPTP